MSYRSLSKFKFRPEPMPARQIGLPATLTHIPLDQLVIDESYQRSITPQGRSNIIRIVESFDWRMFSPLIVAPVEDGRWAIIDGQHRATAALMHGAIRSVPCMVIEASRAEAAACFAAINGAVTAMQKGQMWHARVAASEHFACEVAEICRRAGVTILKHKASTESWRVGDTLAVGTIETTHKKFGAAVLEASLAAITRSRDGNAGLVRADVIKAIAANVVDHRLDAAQSIAVMQAIDIGADIGEATVAAVESRRPVNVELTHRWAAKFAGARRRSTAVQATRQTEPA